ncbi:AbrB/MazE/SpoVT family DNA-binding domain-containing protein [Azospirillum rugosum]|uniref:Uncharacterized protein n=1 Tax=Azospirillum rugosum TaxID=416170 RepID=A0ABS4SN09_9PROT|nr:AbrB/MazE/SpoVT family DNA-binding domain-containing protein [Azospirillum rugosum]MBP2293939.1 hypothetical protein [Azospirillum rugosum]MDQ0526874.1 hypothetical protein [Azospirillum rugosum]
MRTTKLTKMGNLDRGVEMTVDVHNGRIEITKADDIYNRAMAAGRAFTQRYRRTMAILSK